MTWIFILCALLTLLAIAGLVVYHVSLRHEIRRGLYCKLTCVGGSEMGRCPCVGPRDCPNIRNGKVAS